MAAEIHWLERTFAMFVRKIVKYYASVPADRLYSKGTFFTRFSGHDLSTKGNKHLRPCPTFFGRLILGFLFFAKYSHRYRQIPLYAYALPFEAMDGPSPPAFRFPAFDSAVLSVFGSNRKSGDPLSFAFSEPFARNYSKKKSILQVS
jgi:hypothetical protein